MSPATLVSSPAGIPLPIVGPSPEASLNASLNSDRSLTLVPVLHVINGEHFAGAERVQQVLGQHLSEFGYAGHFACLKPGKFLQHCGLPYEQLHLVPMRGRVDWQAIEAVQQLATGLQSRLLHAHTPRAALVTAFVAHRLQIPWVYHVHSPTAHDSTRRWLNLINAWVERLAIASCDLMITVSRSLRREMLERGVSPRRLVAIANGVANIEPIDIHSRQTSRQWRLGLIALMRPRKGVEVAIDAVAELHRRGAPATLELIGPFETPEYERSIRARIAQHHLNDVVQCTGFSSNIPESLRSLDALLLPSLFGEGMPMVVLEALSAGVPVVASQVGGTAEVIRPGHEGYLTTPGCVIDLVAKLDLLMADRHRWGAISQAAVARHRSRFSDVRMTSLVARAYDRLL